MVLRYLGFGVIRGLAWIVALFVVPIIYGYKDMLREKYPNVTWWFLNDTVSIGDGDIDWGDYGRFEKKHGKGFIAFYLQNAIRNSHWGLVLLLSPHNTNLTERKGDMTFLSIMFGRYEPGVNFGTYKAEGIKYFRLSWTIEYLWVFYSHGQLGASNNRYIYKLKAGLIKNKRVNLNFNKN